MTCGVASVVALPLLRETYGPVIQKRRERKRLAADPEAAARAASASQQTTREKLQVLYDNLTRPVILLTRSFICFILSAFMAL